jgi:hypothetical protein
MTRLTHSLALFRLGGRRTTRKPLPAVPAASLSPVRFPDGSGVPSSTFAEGDAPGELKPGF